MEGSTAIGTLRVPTTTTVRRSFFRDAVADRSVPSRPATASVRASQEPDRESDERDSPAALDDRGVRHGRVERREVRGVPAISRSRRSVVRRDRTPGEAHHQTRRSIFFFFFLFSFRLRVSVRRADETETHPFARPRTAAARNSAPPLRSRRRARRSSTPSSASESCSRLWISRSRTRTPRRSLKNQPSTPTTKPPPPPPPSTTRTRASTRRTFSAPPAARATRTTTTTSCCATGSARARTTCPAWTRR